MITCNMSIVVMGGVSWRGGSWEVARPMITAQLKMANVCIFYNVIEFFLWRKITKTKSWSPMALSSSKWHWHNIVKTHQPICVDIQILQLLKGGTDRWGVDSFLWLDMHQRQQILELCKIKFVCVGSTMITSSKVWMPFLVNTMSIHQQE